MIQRCLNCGKTITTYPCKFCKYELAIPDVCPRFQYGKCMTTKRLCPNKSNYMNCEVMDEG